MDMVVIDINLPDIDGIKLGEMISTKYPGTNLVYITGYASTMEQKQINDLNAKAFLEKPFSVDDLTRKIENITPFERKAEVELENKETSESAYLLISLKKVLIFSQSTESFILWIMWFTAMLQKGSMMFL